MIADAARLPNGAPPCRQHLAELVPPADLAAIMRLLIDLAKGGDLRAFKLILDCLPPPPKGRPLPIALPAGSRPKDIMAAHAAIALGLATGAITAEEGITAARLVEMRRQAFAARETDARLAAIERKLGLP